MTPLQIRHFFENTNMTLVYDIDSKTQFIVLYQCLSKKAATIHKYSNIPLSTIQAWIHKIENDIDIFQRQEGSGAKPIISSLIKEQIIEQTMKNPHQASTRKLAAQFSVGRTTVNETLWSGDMNYGKMEIEKTFTKEEKEDRVFFCHDMLKRNSYKIYHAYFTDESGINLSDAHKVKVWSRAGEKIKIEKPAQDIRLNFWGGISYNGATDLHIFRGAFNSKRYQDILQEAIPQMQQSYQTKFYFLHDNSQPHLTAEFWIKNQGIKILRFPTYSPDLSPIENLWAVLKDAVAADNPQNENELEQSLIENWVALTTVENLAPYFVGLEQRYCECIKIKGMKLNC